MNQGITYKKTGDRARGTIQSYHNKPKPLHYGKGAKHSDINALPRKAQQRLFTECFGDYSSRYTIGFEVEKTSLHSSAVREQELFCGFERDGSCGYEAVTHILPLLPACTWRMKVYDLFVKAEQIIDDAFSPSNSSCGGHITIAVDGLTGDQLRELVRKHSGIILSLFRKRLKNSFCGANRRMQEQGLSSYDSVRYSLYDSNGWHRKYQLALVKDNKMVEFRLPSRVQSVKQMMRRYELFYEVVDFAVNTPNGSHASLISKLRPIILSMYNGDTAKAEEVIELSKYFRDYIITGRVSDRIKEFVRD